MSLQKISLLNEYKGNIFEFLVAFHIACHFKIEDQFYSSVGEAFLSILNEQEAFLFKEFPNLPSSLKKFSTLVGSSILNNLKEEEVTHVFLLGKKALAFGDSSLGECDILIKTQTKTLPISLKLSKKGAFVNTKSAGAKSIFRKYFSSFKSSEDAQESLNKFIDLHFDILRRKLYSEYELPYDDHFSNWKMNSLPERPGELKEEGRVILHHYYYDLNQKFYELLSGLYLEDPKLFSKCLLPLAGQSSKDILQVTCFYKNQSENMLDFDSIHLGSISLDERLSLLPPSQDVAYLMINHPHLSLQLRVKPMKTFTQPGYKINSSVKFI